MRFRRYDPAKFELPGRIEKTAEALVCRTRGHKPVAGQNGWELFGTGIYCDRCSALLNPDGSRFLGRPYFRRRDSEA